MASDFEIERGVPLRRERGYKVGYPFLEMEIGDSFLIETSDVEIRKKRQTNVLNAACHLRRWRPETHASFKIATASEPRGVRVWRTA